MALAGITFKNSRTGVVARIIDADEVQGRTLTIEYTAPPGSPKLLIDPHLHQHWSETFEVFSGNAQYRFGRTEGELKSGQHVTMPPHVVHVHPWNAGSTPLRVRQTTTLLRPDPTAIRDTVYAFAMLAWLTNQGKVDARGKPSPLQGALILRTLQRHGGFLAGVPIMIQRALVGLLAAVAERRGYVAFDPRALANARTSE